jgi:hypothetical protein
MYHHQEEEEVPPSEQSEEDQYKQEEGREEEEENMESRYTSELSHDGSLKTEKKLLKEYIRDKNIR